MKKKLLVTLLSLSLLGLVLLPVYAEEDTSTSPFRVKKEVVKERVETKRENVKEKVAERKEDLVARRQANLRKYLQNMVARLRATVLRLEKLITRIESRLEKIAAESPDTDLSAIKTDVARAKTLLASTEDKITDLEGMEDELVNTDSPKQVFADVKTKLLSIQKDLKEVHRLLVHVIGDIKGLRVGEDKNETQ